MNTYAWSCGNPPRNGQISTGFYYRLAILFPKGCKGQGCFTVINHPEFGRICFDDDTGNIAICVDILDQCGNPIRDRHNLPFPFADMDESVVFYAELTSPNEEAVFPEALAGEVDAGGLVFGNIELFKTFEEPGLAEYHSPAHLAREYFPDLPGGDLLFSVSGVKENFETISVKEVEFTVARDLNFVDNIRLQGYEGMPNTVCYPGNSFLAFGVHATIDPDGWPYPCQSFFTRIRGYKDDEQIIGSTGLALAGGFDTEPEQSTYQIDPMRIWEEFDLNWTAGVNGGPERDAMPFSTRISLYHGFRAQDIIVPNPPSGDTLFCSVDPADYLTLTANPSPNLAYQSRIRYKWIVTPLDPPGQGSFPNGDELQSRTNQFRADYPGDVQIQYRIRDIDTGYESELSNPITLHLAPGIIIVWPTPAHYKFVFNTQNPGVLTIPAEAIVNPPEFIPQLQWNITPIVGSSLEIIPGQTMAEVEFKFTGLPSQNGEFGKKWVYASIPAWNSKDSVKVQVYFPKFSLNHTGPVYSQLEPNWYYYWKQTNAGVLVPQGYGDPRCTPNKAGFYQPPEYKFFICDAASGSAQDNCGSPNRIDGIDLFAVTERHEGRHYTDWWTFWPGPNGYIQSNDMDPRAPNAGPKWPPVGDYVPDNLEGTPQYPNLSPATQDSDGIRSYDFDDLGYDAECSWTIGAADTADWSFPGHQY